MNRKDLIRQYREARQPMGVYRVRNTVNGRWLIGSSANLPGMLNRQRFQLDHGSHKNRSLQEDWNRTGPAGFELGTLDTLAAPDEPGYDPARDLRALEAMWFEKLTHSDGPGYESEPGRGA